MLNITTDDDAAARIAAQFAPGRRRPADLATELGIIPGTEFFWHLPRGTRDAIMAQFNRLEKKS